MSSKVKLYMFPGSNAVYTARLMLDHKGIDHKVVKLMPGPHAFILLAKGFPTMAVPALKAEGVRVQGTRWIARALDDLEPERPLFPADPARRKAVEEAERWGEGLQNATRRIFYCAARRDLSAFTSLMTAERGPVKRVMVRMSAPVVIRLATGVHRATDEHGREDLALLPERLDRIDAWIEEGLLDGPELSAADFQIAVNVSALMLADDLRPFVENRPAAALARRVAPDYHGHIGPSLPYEWLEPLRASAATASRVTSRA
jgi:glutathione S-transferase